MQQHSLKRFSNLPSLFPATFNAKKRTKTNNSRTLEFYCHFFDAEVFDADESLTQNGQYTLRAVDDWHVSFVLDDDLIQ